MSRCILCTSAQFSHAGPRIYKLMYVDTYVNMYVAIAI